MPKRDPNRELAPAEGQPSETQAPAEPPVRVYSLHGTGFVDTTFGVSFVHQPYADVAPDLAQRMVEFRPEAVVGKDDDGRDVLGKSDQPLYSLEAPAPATEPNP